MRTVALVIIVLVCARPAAAQSTFLYVNSQAGDQVGVGQVRTYTSPQTDFFAIVNELQGVSIGVGSTTSEAWGIHFSTAGDSGRLQVGTYDNVRRYRSAQNLLTNPGLDAAAANRFCTALVGKFVVREIVYGLNSVIRFAADFEQRCDPEADGVSNEPALFGIVRFNSTLPPIVTIDPPAFTLGPAAGSDSIKFEVIPYTASLTTTTSAGWISLPGNSPAGRLNFAVARNPTTSPRIGTISVGGQIVTITQTANGVPGEPSDLAGATAAGLLRLAWQPPMSGGDATAYRLEAGTQPGATSMNVDVPVGSTTAEFPGVPPGRYFLRVLGINEFGAGPPSRELVLDMTTGTSIPGRPKITSAEVVNGVLTMTWDPPAPTGEVFGYRLEVGTRAGTYNLGTYNLGTTSPFIYRMAFGGNYFLRLRAVNTVGIGPASEEVMIRSGNYISPPPAPLNLRWQGSGSSVTLAWTPPLTVDSDKATRYRVEAGPESGTTTFAGYVVATPTTVTFTGVPPGRYYVRVRGDNRQGLGAPSNEVLVIVR